VSRLQSLAWSPFFRPGDPCIWCTLRCRLIQNTRYLPGLFVRHLLGCYPEVRDEPDSFSYGLLQESQYAGCDLCTSFFIVLPLYRCDLYTLLPDCRHAFQNLVPYESSRPYSVAVFEDWWCWTLLSVLFIHLFSLFVPLSSARGCCPAIEVLVSVDVPRSIPPAHHGPRFLLFFSPKVDCSLDELYMSNTGGCSTRPSPSVIPVPEQGVECQTSFSSIRHRFLSS